MVVFFLGRSSVGHNAALHAYSQLELQCTLSSLLRELPSPNSPALDSHVQCPCTPPPIPKFIEWLHCGLFSQRPCIVCWLTVPDCVLLGFLLQGFCFLYVLRRDDFLSIIEEFPEYSTILQVTSQMCYRRRACSAIVPCATLYEWWCSTQSSRHSVTAVDVVLLIA